MRKGLRRIFLVLVSLILGLFTAGFVVWGEIPALRPLLPLDTAWVIIYRGNHAQFGWYGDQAGDGPASISRSDQQAQVIAATLAMLESMK